MKKHRFCAIFFIGLLMVRSVLAADFSGLLFKANGKVEVLAGGGGTTWKPVKTGMGLIEQDRIRTGQGASAQILLQDGSFYLLKENCALEILELTYDRKSKALGSSLKIHKGRFLGRVSKLLSGANAHFKTPTALVTVRGTELALDVAENGDTNILLNEGRIVVTDFVQERMLPEDQRELLLDLLHELSLKSGQAVRVTSKGIARDKLAAGSFKATQAEFAELRQEGDAAAKQESVLNYETSQTQRKITREETLR